MVRSPIESGLEIPGLDVRRVYAVVALSKL